MPVRVKNARYVPTIREAERALLARAFAPWGDDEDRRALLQSLNRHTPHRYSAVVRLTAGLPTPVAVYDQREPHWEPNADAGRESLAWLSRVAIEDARCDEELRRGDSQWAVRSLLAVPLRDRGRDRWGCVCHFDPEPRCFSREVLVQLEAFRPLIEALFVH
jgi:GAF domain-containing protein